MKLRVKFRKYGPVRFIGHLDVMRYFQKCIRRAEIDIAYTSGFSPHQIMSFAAPLSVGLESNGEYMDIEVNSTSSSSEMVKRFQKAGVTGIDVISVKKLPENAGNAMASVAAAAYTVAFRNTFHPDLNMEAELKAFLSRPSIKIIKETKKGTTEVDLKPGIHVLKQAGDGIYMLVDASSAGNIKPQQVMEAFFAWKNMILPANALFITREDTYMDIGDGSCPDFVPLDAIGEEIYA